MSVYVHVIMCKRIYEYNAAQYSTWALHVCVHICMSIYMYHLLTDRTM